MDNVTKELVQAREALEKMYLDLDILQVEIAKKKRVIAALTELANASEDSAPPADLVKGITDACKTAVLGAGKPILPSEVRDRIKTLGIAEQKNILASVHTVLKRLAESGEIKLNRDGSYQRMTLGERIEHEKAAQRKKEMEYWQSLAKGKKLK
jgi:hypothetical protein